LKLGILVRAFFICTLNPKIRNNFIRSRRRRRGERAYPAAIGVKDVNTVLITDVASDINKFQAVIARLDTPKAQEEVLAHKRAWAKKERCPSTEETNNHTLFVGLFALIGLLMGFIIRGYVIRRIEGRL
ncbi:hypothetical protein WDW86_18170, partial [Bdellovibrionota bacterium FG-2]